ncbi:MAG: deoxyhypusine synthase family protein [Candidatus Lokiarchaeota archaeon]|nr:deoxyhypusine synthase family protein [Candidatus Lokiarchaeota archaeon]
MSDKDFKESLRKVNQFKITDETNIKKFIENIKDTGFNAKRLAKACEIYESMVNDKNCVKFFGLAGAMVPAGMQGVIYDFINEGFIDILVTTGANLTHDIAEALGYHHLQGDMDVNKVDDKFLYQEKINRIYDVFLPNNVYEGIEDFITQLEIPDNNMPISEFLNYLGEQLPEKSQSILKIASKKNIPIFCPAFTDSGLALQLGFHNRQLNLNHFKDMLKLVDMAWEAKTAGVCIIGGGTPKNFIFQSQQFCPNSAKYAIQITMDRPEPGGLSGASLKEAMSWGKIHENAEYSTVISDATIVLPLIYWYLMSSIK